MSQVIYPRCLTGGTILNWESYSRDFLLELLKIMARRRKNRTHLKGPAGPPATNSLKDGTPKSFIIKHGQVGSSLTQLVRDMRRVMEPNTASRLKVGSHLYRYRWGN